MCRGFESHNADYIASREGKEMEVEINAKIKDYFKIHKLPKPVTIKHIGKWAHGECYAVTCGLIRLKKYCVYLKGDGEIKSVRKR